MAVIPIRTSVTILSIAFFVALASSQTHAFTFLGRSTTKRIDAVGQFWCSHNLLQCDGCLPLANATVKAMLNSTIPPTTIVSGVTGPDGSFNVSLVADLINSLLRDPNSELSTDLMYDIMLDLPLDGEVEQKECFRFIIGNSPSNYNQKLEIIGVHAEAEDVTQLDLQLQGVVNIP